MSVHITGRTKLAGVIGWPLDHTLSPAMHNAVYENLGLDWVYIPLPLRDETDLLRFLGAARVLPFVGFNVTMPFKQVMLSMCDDVAMLAKMAGAVNAVHVVDGRFIGYNTDGRGLTEALELYAGFDAADKDVAVVGAGGAAGAAVVSLILAKAKSISVVSRNVENGQELVDRLSGHARNTQLQALELGSDAEETVRSSSLIVNATPVGMKQGDVSPVPPGWLGTGQLVFDMVYGRGETDLVREARARGAEAFDGLGMLVCQGATAVDIWHDSAQIRTPRDVMRDAAVAAAAAADGGERAE